MKKVAVAFLVLIASFLVVSCGAKQPPVMPKVEFGYEKGAVLLQLKADPQLNLYQGSPHTLSLCLYQLRDPNGFNQLAADQNGLYKLLECSRFDPTVATATRLDVQPASNRVRRSTGPRGLSMWEWWAATSPSTKTRSSASSRCRL